MNASIYRNKQTPELLCCFDSCRSTSSFLEARSCTHFISNRITVFRNQNSKQCCSFYVFANTREWAKQCIDVAESKDALIQRVPQQSAVRSRGKFGESTICLRSPARGARSQCGLTCFAAAVLENALTLGSMEMRTNLDSKNPRKQFTSLLSEGKTRRATHSKPLTLRSKNSSQWIWRQSEILHQLQFCYWWGRCFTICLYFIVSFVFILCLIWSKSIVSSTFGSWSRAVAQRQYGTRNERTSLKTNS